MIKIVKAMRKLSFLFIKNVAFRRTVNNLIHNLIKSKVSTILEKESAELPIEKDFVSHNLKYVWVLWLQGEKNAPPLVRACIRSIKREVPDDYTVIIVDENNISDFITIPEYILEKYKSGKITKTHYSDIVRWALLATYGGVWMDSTIYLAKKLVLKNTDGFVTLKTPAEDDDKYISKGRWTIFFIGVPPDYQPAKKMMNLLYKYWITEGALVDYFLVDYLLDILVESDLSLRKDLENNKHRSDNLYYLMVNANEKITSLIANEIDTSTPGIYKMSHKVSFSGFNSPGTVLSYLLSDEK